MSPNKNKAVTARQLLEMSEQELNELESVCWHDSDYSGPRCECVGISDLEIEKDKNPGSSRYNIKYSDINGDPFYQVLDLDQPIHQVGDGIWDYGLYLSHEW